MARELSDHEREVLAQRARSHRATLAEGAAQVRELSARVGFAPPTGPLEDAQLARLEAALEAARRDPDPHTIVWWVARLGHLLGAHLQMAHAGHWYLDQVPEGRSFMRTVVGAFGQPAPDPEAECIRYDPFRIAATVFAEHLALAPLLADIECELSSPPAQAPPAEEPSA